MSEEYVTRSEFHETLRRMEEFTKANIARIEAKEEASEARCQALIAEIRGEVKAMNARIDGIIDTMNDIKAAVSGVWSKVWTVAGITVTLSALAIAVVQIWAAMKG